MNGGHCASSNRRPPRLVWAGFFAIYGKIGIPGAILRKTNRLTEEEHGTVKN